MRLAFLLFALALVCFSMAACATPAQTTAAITAVGASAAAIVDAIAPMLPPETLAKLQSAASHVDGTVQATATAVGTIADAFAQMKTSVGSQFAAQAEGLNKAVLQLQALPSREELHATNAGYGLAATGAARALSAVRRAKASTAT